MTYRCCGFDAGSDLLAGPTSRPQDGMSKRYPEKFFLLPPLLRRAVPEERAAALLFPVLTLAVRNSPQGALGYSDRFRA